VGRPRFLRDLRTLVRSPFSSVSQRRIFVLHRVCFFSPPVAQNPLIMYQPWPSLLHLSFFQPFPSFLCFKWEPTQRSASSPCFLFATHSKVRRQLRAICPTSFFVLWGPSLCFSLLLLGFLHPKRAFDDCLSLSHSSTSFIFKGTPDLGRGSLSPPISKRPAPDPIIAGRNLCFLASASGAFLFCTTPQGGGGWVLSRSGFLPRPGEEEALCFPPLYTEPFQRFFMTLSLRVKPVFFLSVSSFPSEEPRLSQSEHLLPLPERSKLLVLPA